MLTQEVLSYPAQILSEEQRQYYFDKGCVRVEGLVSDNWLQRLRQASLEMVAKTNGLSKSNEVFILEEGHTVNRPRLKRLNSPVTHHPDFWEFAARSNIADAVSDVVGPNVRFYHSKLNYKWADGGQHFDWHQDIQAWPHTNYSPVTVGLLLDDVTMAQGPLVAIRSSHLGELYDLYNEEGNFVIRIPETKLGWITEEMKEYMIGPAGTVFLLNCRTIHGSTVNNSDRSRPLLLNVFSAADALPYGTNPIPSRYEGKIVRGKATRWSHHDPRPCLIPPDWSDGYAGPWVHQNQK